MATGINVYNEAGELILDNSRKILCTTNNPISSSSTMKRTDYFDFLAYYYDASTSAAQSLQHGAAFDLPYVDGSEDAVWVGCTDASVNFFAFSATQLGFYPYVQNKSVAYKHVATRVPDRVTSDEAYMVVYNEAGEICWSAASLLRSVRIIGFMTLTNGMLWNKSVMSFTVPPDYPIGDIYVPMFTGVSASFYNADGGSPSYLHSLIFKFSGNTVYAKLFANSQELSGVGSKDAVWTGGTRLIPIAYIPAL